MGLWNTTRQDWLLQGIIRKQVLTSMKLLLLLFVPQPSISFYQLLLPNIGLYVNLMLRMLFFMVFSLKKVYMRQPPGFVDSRFPFHMCHLKKTIYSLKQVLRAWFHRFSSFLLTHGFTCSQSDPSIFTFCHDTHIIILLLYIDEIILTGSSPVLFYLHSFQAICYERFRRSSLFFGSAGHSFFPGFVLVLAQIHLWPSSQISFSYLQTYLHSYCCTDHPHSLEWWVTCRPYWVQKYGRCIAIVDHDSSWHCICSSCSFSIYSCHPVLLIFLMLSIFSGIYMVT